MDQNVWDFAVKKVDIVSTVIFSSKYTSFLSFLSVMRADESPLLKRPLCTPTRPTLRVYVTEREKALLL